MYDGFNPMLFTTGSDQTGGRRLGRVVQHPMGSDAFTAGFLTEVGSSRCLTSRHSIIGRLSACRKRGRSNMSPKGTANPLTRTK